MPRICGPSRKRKLTDDQVTEIRAAAGVVGMRVLASRFGVSRSTIRLIQRGETYRLSSTSKPTRFGCEHPRTSDNVYVMGGVERCKICHSACRQRSRAKARAARVPFKRPAPRLDLSSNPAVQLYRATKASRPVPQTIERAAQGRARSVPRYWRGAA